MKKITVLVTDLDNTLFDWLEMWYRPFAALLSALAAQTGRSPEELKPMIRSIHQSHGTAEYAFVVHELHELLGGRASEAEEKYARALQTFRREREKTLVTFPTVPETLLSLKKRGVLVVGYTESLAFYSNFRVRRLGLDGLIDVLYSPPDHSLPTGLDRQSIRSHPADSYELRTTTHRFTPPDEQKPNPELLRDIIRDVAGVPEHTVYVGDSLLKDVAMAQDAGVEDVLAAYGTTQHREAYELLRQVTHWTDVDVQREKTLLERRSVVPSHTLSRQFDELLALFDFGSVF